MKFAFRYIALILVLTAFGKLGTLARTESPDTLYYFPEASRMIVTSSPDEINVIIKSNGRSETITLKNDETDNDYYRLDNKATKSSDLLYKGHKLFVFPSPYKHSFWSIGIDGFTLGLSSANGQPQPKGFQWSKSIEIGWLNALAIKYNLRNSVFSLGVGLNCKNFRNSTSLQYLDYTEEKGLFWSKYEEGIIGKGSRLMIFSVQFPLLWQYTFPTTSLSLRMGPIFNLNTYSEIKTNYLNNAGDKCSRTLKGISPRLFTPDIFLSLSLYNTCGIYMRYSPVRIMNESHGLDFLPFSIGVSVGI